MSLKPAAVGPMDAAQETLNGPEHFSSQLLPLQCRADTSFSDLNMKQFTELDNRSKAICSEICRNSMKHRELSIALKEALLAANIIDIDDEYCSLSQNNSFKQVLSAYIACGLAVAVNDSTWGKPYISDWDLFTYGNGADKKLLTYIKEVKKLDIGITAFEELCNQRKRLTAFIARTRNQTIDFMELTGMPLTRGHGNKRPEDQREPKDATANLAEKASKARKLNFDNIRSQREEGLVDTDGEDFIAAEEDGAVITKTALVTTTTTISPTAPVAMANATFISSSISTGSASAQDEPVQEDSTGLTQAVNAMDLNDFLAKLFEIPNICTSGAFVKIDPENSILYFLHDPNNTISSTQINKFHKDTNKGAIYFDSVKRS